MTKIAAPLFVVLAATALLWHAAVAAEPWQSSWEAFVETYNKCIRQPGCDVKHMANKTVVWVGTVKDVTRKDGKLNVGMDMSGGPFVDKQGATSNIINLTLHPNPTEEAAWQQASVGQRVKFKTKTMDVFHSPVGFSSFGPGKNFAIIFTDGAEVIEVMSK